MGGGLLRHRAVGGQAEGEAAAAVERVARGPFLVGGELQVAPQGVQRPGHVLDEFGEQVGGAGRVAAHRALETAWWGEGVDRAVAYVNAHAAPGARVDRQCIEPSHLAWFREDLWAAMTTVASEATWIVSYAPASHPCALPPDARRVFTVTAGGAVLAHVYERP